MSSMRAVMFMCLIRKMVDRERAPPARPRAVQPLLRLDASEYMKMRLVLPFLDERTIGSFSQHELIHIKSRRKQIHYVPAHIAVTILRNTHYLIEQKSLK